MLPLTRLVLVQIHYISFAGSGKTETLAITSMLLLANPNIYALSAVDHPTAIVGDDSPSDEGEDSDESDSSGEGKQSPSALLQQLLTEVVLIAYVVCTMPHASGANLYKRFKTNYARVVVLDEAGAMHRADTLLV
ncbi:unnamed protein product [Parascedosporium putredinis]|uniref:Uncharacterized protein n=1 Tax=Parascedosporium putredinis TaxID=1442378 RepID=A0A9P1GWI6_9PEZI|nr:unnamed protein product [Parascedosporium putredinis]CAI7988363.1 unnamed protein product [Parascedosporium putredinis]